MEVLEREIQQITIETFAKSFIQESFTYGFNLSDYLCFINLLLGLALNNKKKTDVKEKSKIESKALKAISLPLRGERVLIRTVEPSKDLLIFEKWLADEYGRYFLLSQKKTQIMATTITT